MSAPSDGTGSTHSFQEFFLVLPRGFTWQFDLKIYRLAVRNTVSENIAFSVLTDIHDSAVLRIELANRVISCYAAVLA